MNSNSIIKTASYAFSCPLCGMKVKVGDSCIEEEGVLTCPCVMPARKLIPMTRIKEMQAYIDKLEFRNLKLRLEIEILTTYPHGVAAKKIIRKYTLRRKQLQEIELTRKN
jgi:hypothetical protein